MQIFGQKKPTLFLIFAALIFWFVVPIIVKLQLRFHKKHYPNLVEKSPGIFKGMKIFLQVFSIICVFFAFVVLFEIKI